MADEPTQQDPPKPPESPPEPRKEPPASSEPRPEDRRSEAPQEPATAKCPDCRARVDVDDLDTHRFLVHNIDRRAKPKDDSGSDDGKDKPTSPPKREPLKPSGGAPKPKQSRWAEVGWGRKDA
jgi:hypothetical protein